MSFILRRDAPLHVIARPALSAPTACLAPPSSTTPALFFNPNVAVRVMQRETPEAPTKSANMLSVAQTPIFNWDNHHRPAVSSPLSSSPVRASSPLSPLDRNKLAQRQTQSSPIQPPKFKFATRPTKPNPVVRKREETQEKRRKNFLANVNSKRDEQRWNRRDIEGQFLKKSYYDDMGQLVHDAPEVSEADIEDAMAFEGEAIPDDMMVDSPPNEEDEIEAMVASYEEHQSSKPPHSPAPSDEDYEDVFAELIAREQSQENQPVPSGERMDLGDEDSAMTF